ncbi:hypothetical protein WJX73_002212 [Symbiochloris irregularis]|uniref:DNA-directed primase/polymerase protein n=1 Tax=Symbiochloris irregularis TaxID=706552 RepID=A0AAW1NS56_9CHLO
MVGPSDTSANTERALHHKGSSKLKRAPASKSAVGQENKALHQNRRGRNAPKGSTTSTEDLSSRYAALTLQPSCIEPAPQAKQAQQAAGIPDKDPKPECKTEATAEGRPAKAKSAKGRLIFAESSLVCTPLAKGNPRIAVQDSPVNGSPMLISPAPPAAAVQTAAEAQRVWAGFNKQHDALAFASACNAAASNRQASHAEASTSAASGHMPEGASQHASIVKVFCKENPGDQGWYRSFVAAAYPALWQRYKNAQERHFYEVIQEGHPCHLYFDLEFNRDCNATVDGDALVACLLTLVAEGFRHNWGVEMQDDDVIELESSTQSKFSRHIIIPLQGVAFADNSVVGSFVSQLLSKAQSGGLRVLKEAARDGHRVHTTFVDTAVYSRNRHFRMMWSSKGGKPAVLRLSKRCAAQATMQLPPQELLQRTLVCNVDASARLLTLGGPAIAQCPSSKANNALLGNVQRVDGMLKVAWKHDALDDIPAAEHLPMKGVMGCAERALPWLEAMASARGGNQKAYARTIAQCGRAGRIAFSMLGPGSHYCSNIRRMHTSNHVFFVMDFVSGTYAQKCHDPDCSSYTSSWMQLPQELLFQM